MKLDFIRQGADSSKAGTPAADAKASSAPASDVIVIRPAGEPLLKKQLPLNGKAQLKLSPYQLVKGDQVKVTLEVVDFRGKGIPGQVGTSDPLLFNVTDESGIYAAISESDEKSAKQLDAIIKRQLGIGGSK